LSGLCDDEGLGCNPNKHFRKAKIASVLTLALLAVCALPINSLKLDRFHPLHGAGFSVIIALVYFFKNFRERA